MQKPNHRRTLHTGPMAIVTSAYSVPICGKLGGMYFQRSRWGLMARTRRYSISVPSAAAQRRMAAFHELANWWAYRLTTAQRLTWGVYSNTHPLSSPCTGKRFLTPMNWFVKLNMPRLLAGDALLLFAP